MAEAMMVKSQINLRSNPWSDPFPLRPQPPRLPETTGGGWRDHRLTMVFPADLESRINLGCALEVSKPLTL